MGYIYIIRNTLNDKVYIGQTIQPLEKRFSQHIRLACGNKTTAKLYEAMRDIGIEYFYIEKILECTDKELNMHEQHYVEQHNSLKNGYNTVYPCSSTGKKPVHDYEDKVIEMYMNGYSFARIAKEANISAKHANELILKHEVKREYTISLHSVNNKPLVMYDDNFNPIRTFESINKAYKWLWDNTEFRVTRYGVYAFIDVACHNGNIAYGHRWQLQSDLTLKDKIFRTKFDKEAYILGGKAYQPEGKQYYIVDGALNNVKTFKKYSKSFCIDCGKELGDNRNKRCLTCANKARKIENSDVNSLSCTCIQCKRIVGHINAKGLCASCYNVVAKGKSPKPSKEELKALLDKGLQKKQIADLYGRTASTVQYWVNNYGLK